MYYSLIDKNKKNKKSSIFSHLKAKKTKQQKKMSLSSPTGCVSYIYAIEVEPSQQIDPKTGKKAFFHAWRHFALLVPSKEDEGKSLKLCKLNDGIRYDCVLHRDTVTQRQMEDKRKKILAKEKVEFPLYTVRDRVTDEKILEVVHRYNPKERGDDRFIVFKLSDSKVSKKRREKKMEVDSKKENMQFFNDEVCKVLGTKEKWQVLKFGAEEYGHIFYKPKVRTQ